MSLRRQAIRLALCVDDFGLHEGVNRAVFRLAELGRVNAVSCMTGGPAWHNGAQELAALDRSRIDVGLHLDLTELPLDPRSRRPLRSLIAAAYAGRLEPGRLRTEVERQLDAFEQHSGRAPDYIDGHQHVHQLPIVRDVLLDVLSQRYAGRTPWLRSTCAGASGSGLRGRLKPRLIEFFGARALGRLAHERGFRTNRHLLGVHDFRVDAARYRSLLAGWLHDAGDGDLLMCHPSVPLPVNDSLLSARTSECEVLCEDRFNAAIAQHNIELAPISRTIAGTPG